MVNSVTPEGLAQRALDVGILDHRQLQTVWSELGSQNVPLENFKQALLRNGLLTNFQLERILNGFRDGFFYGAYKVLYAVGAGTFARVFRAAHRDTNKIYAVKVLRKRFSNPIGEDGKNRTTIESFRREGELGATLKHPNIVPIHEVYSKGLTHYIVMDFVEGRNLREFWKAQRQFDPLEATNILIDVMSGLSYAHAKGITHRDMKMSNVLLSSDGTAQLVDFGLAALDASASEEALDNTPNPRTVDYVGLERATGVGKYDIRSDVFFSGCIYYQLLSGKLPMSETRDRMQRLARSRYQDIPPIRDVAPKIPLALAMIVNKSIEFDPTRRYQKPGEMLADLKLAAKRLMASKDDTTDGSTESAALEGHDSEGHPRALMIVEADVKMQDLFRHLFKRRGYRVLVTSDPERAMNRFHEDPNAAEFAIFSAGAIGRHAVETFQRFSEQPVTKGVPALLILGQKQSQWKQDVTIDDRHLVAEMPLKARELRKIVRSLLLTG
ncbi:MAG: protein kinase [Pirellulales bacterium]|nr:protein kinase [Pirellulales bacterium]